MECVQLAAAFAALRPIQTFGHSRKRQQAARTPYASRGSVTDTNNRTRVMVLDWFRATKPALVKELAEANVLFDIAMVEGVGGVAGLFERIPPAQIAFGSNAPFFYFEAALLKLREAGFGPEQFRARND